MIPLILLGVAGLVVYKMKSSPIKTGTILNTNSTPSIWGSVKQSTKAVLYSTPIGPIMTLEQYAETLAKQKLKISEGDVNVIYKDTRGFATGGIGHRLTSDELKKYPVGTRISDTQKTVWFVSDSAKAFKAAISQATELGKYTPEFIAALTEVNFQLGTGWKNKFANTYKFLKAGNAKQAIKNLSVSDWAKQTPVRVANFQNAIRKAYSI